MKTRLNHCKTTLAPLALIAASCALSSSALAADMASDMTSDFNYVQVHAMQASYGDISGFDLRGAELRAGFGWDQVFTEVRYRAVEDSSGDIKLEDERWNITLGYAWPISEKLRVDVRANYGSISLEGRDSIGFYLSKPKYEGLSSYVHYDWTDTVQVYGGLEWQNLPENADQKAYHLGARYKFDAFSIGAEYTKYSDSDAISLFARYQF